jgi:hypothetical protein
MKKKTRCGTDIGSDPDNGDIAEVEWFDARLLILTWLSDAENNKEW